MKYRTTAVHVNDSDHNAERVRIAADLALRNDAHLVGLAATGLPSALYMPGMADEDRFELCRWLEQHLSLPGPLLVLWAGESPTLEEIRRGAFEPIYPAIGA